MEFASDDGKTLTPSITLTLGFVLPAKSPALKDEDAWGKERPYFDDVSKKYLSEEEVKELEETYRVIIFKTLTEEDIKRIRAERGTE